MPEATEASEQAITADAGADAGTATPLLTRLRAEDTKLLRAENELIALYRQIDTVATRCAAGDPTCPNLLVTAKSTRTAYQSKVTTLKSLATTQQNMIDAEALRLSRPAPQVSGVILAAWARSLRSSMGPSIRGVTRWTVEPNRFIALAKPRTAAADCIDLVESQWLYDFADTVVAANHGAYISAQAKLIRALDCVSASQALALGDALVVAHGQAIAYAKAKMPWLDSEAANRTLFSVLGNTYLNVWDHSKLARGKLYVFLVKNKLLLKQTMAHPSMPVSLYGLALRDRKRGQMVVIAPSAYCESTKWNAATRRIDGPRSGCVSVTGLVDGMLDPSRIGLGICGALDMMLAAFDPVTGYHCDDGLCGGAAGTQTGGTGGAASTRPPGIEMARRTGQTPTGASVAELERVRCGGAARGGTTPAVAALELCAANVTRAGASLVRCMTMGQEPGVDAGPATIGADLTNPENSACGSPLAAGPGGDGLGKARKGLNLVRDRATQLINDNSKKYSEALKNDLGLNIAPAALQEAANAAVANAVVVPDGTDLGGGEGGYDPKTGTVAVSNNQAEQAAGQGLFCAGGGATCTEVDPNAKLLVHEAMHKVIDEQCKANPCPDAAKDTQKQDDAISKMTDTCSPNATPGTPQHCAGNGGKFCAPESGDCEDCSPEAANVRDFFECTNGGRGPEPYTPPNTPPGARPGVVDPVPWDAARTSPAWQLCVESQIAPGPGGIQPSPACAVIRCDQGEPVLSNGVCVCSAQGARPAMSPACMRVSCPPDATPVMGEGGSCRCSSPGGSQAPPSRTGGGFGGSPFGGGGCVGTFAAASASLANLPADQRADCERVLGQAGP